jgi:hypothetical protein
MNAHRAATDHRTTREPGRDAGSADAMVSRIEGPSTGTSRRRRGAGLGADPPQCDSQLVRDLDRRAVAERRRPSESRSLLYVILRKEDSVCRIVFPRHSHGGNPVRCREFCEADAFSGSWVSGQVHGSWPPNRAPDGPPDREVELLSRNPHGTSNGRLEASLCPSAPARYRGSGEAFMPETSSFLIFLPATMPQAQSPDTGEGSGCGRF